MLENVSKLGVKGFFTFRFSGFETFQPCATSISKEEAIKKTLVEKNEKLSIKDYHFPEIFCLNNITTDHFVMPIHLHPFMWQERTLRDVEWYKKTKVPFIKFLNFKNEDCKFLPRDLTVLNERSMDDGLSWLHDEGYAYDEDLELAKVKSAMELVEKDIVTLWWHRETVSENVIVNEDDELLNMLNMLKNQKIGVNILNLQNNINVYVVVVILTQNEFPNITYGSAAHFNIKQATKKAIYEAVSCVAGIRHQFIHLKEKYNFNEIPKCIISNSTKYISSYKKTYKIEDILDEVELYYTYIKVENGFLVKSYSYELQPTLKTKTVHLTRRFFEVANTQPVIKNNFPFM